MYWKHSVPRGQVNRGLRSAADRDAEVLRVVSALDLQDPAFVLRFAGLDQEDQANERILVLQVLPPQDLEVQHAVVAADCLRRILVREIVDLELFRAVRAL